MPQPVAAPVIAVVTAVESQDPAETSQKVKIFLAVLDADLAISVATPAIATVGSPAAASIPAGHAVQDAVGVAPAEVDKYVLAAQADRNTH